MKIYTCTPVNFKGNYTFFARDSGLVSVGLNLIGIESRPIMPGCKFEDDDIRLIRTDYKNLESTNWWKSLEIDALIFYSWGNGKYNKIAQSIKDAGIVLMINMDTGGLISPWFETNNYFKSLYIYNKTRYGYLFGTFLSIIKFCISLYPNRVDKPRIKQFELADIIGAVSPIALTRLSKFCIVYKNDQLVNKIKHISHPVSKYLQYDFRKKKKKIICIGRWEDPVKNLDLALQALIITLNLNPEYEVVFIGSGKDIIEEKISKLNIKDKFKLIGNVKNDELIDYYCDSQISLCTSNSEAGHTVSEEALCCGNSIVAPDSPTLPALNYYIAHNSGQLGGKHPKDLANAICNEIQLWKIGQRNPKKISEFWINELHVDRIAHKIANEVNMILQKR